MGSKELKSQQFFRLYNAAQTRIYAYLLMLVHNHSDAEDLLQDTASVLWERFDDFDRTKSFAAWGIGIARNQALTFLKSKRTSRPLFTDDFYHDIAEVAVTESEQVDRRLGMLRECMKRMSLSNQKLISLRFEQGVTVKAISQSSGCSADALYKKISRIYNSLQNCVSQKMLEGGQF